MNVMSSIDTTDMPDAAGHMPRDRMQYTHLIGPNLSNVIRPLAN